MVMPGGIRRRVRPLPHVPVITAPLEVDLTCAYKGLPHFTHFAGNIKFVGGINKPKLVQVGLQRNRCLKVKLVLHIICSHLVALIADCAAQQSQAVDSAGNTYRQLVKSGA